MQTMTPRQLEILRFIRDFRNRCGYSPSMQEIADHYQITKITAFEHVAALVRKKVLLRGDKHKARSLRVNPVYKFQDETPLKLPLIGRIAAGMPIEAVEDRNSLNLDELFTPDDTFALEVAGDSMIDEQIRDGDYVLCRRCQTAVDGETVVALLDDGEATLKKFYREKDRIRLQPANKKYKPIYAENVTIQGVVIGLIRQV